MARPLLTLTTDFGLSDHYVGVMKGVILGICPRARIVDISHAAAPFEIAEGAFLIGEAWRYFPPGTVHVVVVDPGVGTERRPILAEVAGHYFVAPDNGVLGMVFPHGKPRVRAIANRKYFLEPVSQTFHGRDIFAPVAAHVAAGVPVARMGPAIRDYIQPGFDEPVSAGEGAWDGRVLHVDRFGNLVTNFRAAGFPEIARGRFALVAGPVRVETLARNYEGREPGELFAIEGSSGYLEISASRASAALATGCRAGAPVRLELGVARPRVRSRRRASQRA